MFRFLSGQRRLNVSPVLTAVRFGVVAFTLVSLPVTGPRPDTGAAGAAWTVSFVVTAAVCVVWVLLALRGGELAGPHREQVFTATLAVLALSGGTLAGLSSLSSAIAIGCVVTSSAGVQLRPEVSLAITAETVAAFLLTGLAMGAPAGTLLGYPFAFVGLWAFGLTRHTILERAEEAERTLEQTRRALEAETQAAALAERARIAREIHDVLAHSLAAVSVNLQAAEGLLGALPESPELAKALECVERAGAFTRDGLAEARRAVTTLRDTATRPPAPLAAQLERLVAEFRESGDAPASLRVLGTERPVSAERGLTVYRAAQEALTNARKHAPGLDVTLTLEFTPDAVGLRAANPLTAPTGAEPVPLAASGGGHGLTGLRERAALAGGTLTAGPDDGQWLVCLRIPA